jgi:hypothetical protein
MSKKSVKIKSIRCVKTINKKEDRIVIAHQADGGEQVPFPIEGSEKLEDGDSLPLNLTLEYEHELLFTIFDKSKEEYVYVGSHDFQETSASGTVNVFNMIRDAEYTISYES